MKRAVKNLGMYGLVVLLLGLLGAWLAVDSARERDRLLEDAGRLALNKSQFVGRSFGDTFLAADYVLRDVIGHVNFEQEFSRPGPETGTRLDRLLKSKVATVPGLTDLVVLDANCIFRAVAHAPLHGTRSRQSLCTEPRIAVGESLRIQYMPPEKSASRQPVVLMSRILGSSDGRLLGGVMAVIELAYAQQWLSGFPINEGDVLALVDIDSTLLARVPERPQALGKRSPAEAGNPPFENVGAGQVFFGRSPYDGAERVYGLNSLERFPFVAIVGFDQDRVLHAWRHRVWLFGAGLFALLVLALLATRAQLVLVRQREEQRRLAITDGLTGIANRRHLLDLGQQEVARAQRYGRPLAVLMLDIDRFKVINDTWGHPTGDVVIRSLASTLIAAGRQQDHCGRLGGEEFAVLLPETDLSQAQSCAERLRAAVESTTVFAAEGGESIRFTVSIGVAMLTDSNAQFDTLLGQADEALYQAKQGGRNRVCSYRKE